MLVDDGHWIQKWGEGGDRWVEVADDRQRGWYRVSRPNGGVPGVALNYRVVQVIGEKSGVSIKW